MRALWIVAAICFSGAACVTAAGQAWVQGEDEPARAPEHRGWASPERRASSAATREEREAPSPTGRGSEPAPDPAAEDIVAITDRGSGKGAQQGPAFQSGERFRNTYYDFPREDGKAAQDASIYDASCKLIASVTRDFHDRVCVQGSGRLRTGETVSFAKRDCDCASTCPRTGQKICFERLDPARFPSGRGALGTPITPLRTVAVDSTVIPLGTVLFIPEFRGITLPDGSRHDGCFVAEDRGIRVTGRQIDIFTGDPAVTARLNTLLPSNRGVRVHADDPRCAARRL